MFVDLIDLRAELLIITKHVITVICNISVLNLGLHFCLLQCRHGLISLRV